MSAMQRVVLSLLLAACLWMGWCLWNAPTGAVAGGYGGMIKAQEAHIDTLVKKYEIHDTIQKTLRAKAITMIQHDTVLDTICLAAFDTIVKALDECDSAKEYRDSVIVRQDTLVQTVRDSSRVESKSNFNSYAITALVSAVVMGLLAIFLMR